MSLSKSMMVNSNPKWFWLPRNQDVGDDLTLVFHGFGAVDGFWMLLVLPCTTCIQYPSLDSCPRV